MREHPTRLELERLSVDDLLPPLAEATRAHVSACVPCSALLDELSSSRERHFAVRPAGVFMDAIEARRNKRRWRWPLFALVPTAAAAAGLLLFVGQRPDVRMKGGGIDVMSRRGEVMHHLGPDDRISAGDWLGIAPVAGEKTLRSVWVVDASGRVDALTALADLPGSDTGVVHSAIVDAPCEDLVVLASGEEHWRQASDDALRTAARSPAPPSGLVVRRLRCR